MVNLHMRLKALRRSNYTSEALGTGRKASSIVSSETGFAILSLLNLRFGTGIWLLNAWFSFCDELKS